MKHKINTIINLQWSRVFLVFSFLVILIVAPQSVFSKTSTELTAQINSLLAQIQALQSQLGTVQSGTTNTTTTTTAGYTFTTNLKKGDSGEAVLQLQKVLNKDVDTRVAVSGVGSAGNETNYFGGLTKAAVIKFQNKFATAVLAPVGLSVGTGYVGPSTRAELNKMSSVTTTTGTPTTGGTVQKSQTTKTPESLKKNSIISTEGGVGVPPLLKNISFDSKELYIMFPSKYFGSVGTKVSLQGTSFSKNDNSVLFGDIYIAKNISPAKDGTISFIIPKSLKTGKYKVWVENKNGKSKNNTFFIVTDPFAVAPVIKSISPKIVKYGDTITIKGTGFTKKDNTLRVSYAVVDGITSNDGKTIIFKVIPSIFKKGISNSKNNKKTDFNFWITVENKDGISNSYRFIFNI